VDFETEAEVTERTRSMVTIATQPHFVYALCEPDGKTIRYVGVTTNAFKRFRTHYLGKDRATWQWIESLRDRGFVPAMVILCECSSRSDGFAEEARQIKIAQATFGNLLNWNQIEPPKRTRTPYPEVTIEFAGISKTEFEWSRYLSVRLRDLRRRFKQEQPASVLTELASNQPFFNQKLIQLGLK
jgi:predicted GIY-YIG superfamily endonuclease